MVYMPIPAREHPLAKANATISDIEALAEKYEPSIAKAINDALQQNADAVDLDALAAALAKGDLDLAIKLLTDGLQKLQGAKAPIENAVWAAGIAVGMQPVIRGVEFHFDRLNPALIDWLNTYSLGLIRQISDTTKEAVRASLVDGMRAGKNPRVTARNVKQIVGLTARQSNAVLNFRKELESFHTKRSAAGWNLGAQIDRVNGAQVFRPDEAGLPKDAILERRLRDFRYDKALAAAMQSGKPLKPEQIDKMVDAYARKYRKYRAETIARTESIRAANMGVQEGWRQAVMSGKVDERLLRRFWKVARDERTCPVCNAIPKLNADGVKLGESFQSDSGPIFLPPMHPSCRCHVWIRMMEPFQVGLEPAPDGGGGDTTDDQQLDE